ncbi:Heat-inducible transcription repressor HrcA [Chlamydiales bacterium STE3]|nr:Heat-inducible transcription repressor HrcA [Chlamydiales bacterium STE3]
MKKFNKEGRKRKVLIGLIEHYIDTCKPVGSNILKECGFDDLSSATIRNYFAQLEEEGFLTQQHSSGGRIPTAQSFKFYAKEFSEEVSVDSEKKKLLNHFRKMEAREIATSLREAAQELSNITGCAIFLSAPRFDNDLLIDIKVITIDHHRCLCVLVSDFGVIRTEVLYTDHKLTALEAKRIEAYFHWRLTSKDKPENLSPQEELQAKRFYNEVMVRYLVGYSNFIDEDIFTTGFSHLLHYPELRDATTLASTLALFENTQGMRLVFRDCIKHNALRCWIDDDLKAFTQTQANCSVIVHPYSIHQSPAGAIGLLGPLRIPYRQLFGTLRYFSECVSEGLTKNIYKYKLSYRKPSTVASTLIENEQQFLIGNSQRILIE